MDHKITVSRIGKTKRGLVIDITQENPNVGELSDVFDFKQTTQEIGVIYGLPGWRMMLNYYG